MKTFNIKEFITKLGIGLSFMFGTWIWLASPVWYICGIGLLLFILGSWLIDYYKNTNFDKNGKI